MGMCLNKKVLAGLAAAGIVIFVAAPGLIGFALPLLVIAICPLSMLVMMRSMSGSGTTSCASRERSHTAGEKAEIARLHAEVQQLRVERSLRADPAGLRPTS